MTEQKGEPGEYWWHVHHDVLVEKLTEPAETRREFVRAYKPADQIEERLRLFRPSPGLMALHAKECQNCPWDGSSIFPPVQPKKSLWRRISGWSDSRKVGVVLTVAFTGAVCALLIIPFFLAGTPVDHELSVSLKVGVGGELTATWALTFDKGSTAHGNVTEVCIVNLSEVEAGAICVHPSTPSGATGNKTWNIDTVVPPNATSVLEAVAYSVMPCWNDNMWSYGTTNTSSSSSPIVIVTE